MLQNESACERHVPIEELHDRNASPLQCDGHHQISKIQTYDTDVDDESGESLFAV